MAKIMDNPQGGRRTISLSPEDIMMIVSRVQQQLRGKSPSYTTLRQVLATQPLYIPEERI